MYWFISRSTNEDDEFHWQIWDEFIPESRICWMKFWTRRKTQVFSFVFNSGSKIPSYFSQKRFAVVIQDRWNKTIRNTLTTPMIGEESKEKRKWRHRPRVWNEKNQRRSHSNFEPTSGNHLSKGQVFHIVWRWKLWEVQRDYCLTWLSNFE